MLSNILIIVLAALQPLFCYLFFQAGYQMGRREIGRKSLENPQKKQGVPSSRESEDDRKKRILLENIENYGTKLPQKKVK